MAKKQSFGDKNAKKKAEAAFKSVKLVFSTKSAKTGQWRFSEKFVKVPTGTDDVKFMEQEIKKA